MLSRPIPASGEALPVIGLGTWRCFDVDPDGGDLSAQRAVLDRLLAAGGGVVDSSPMYGHAEAAAGRLMEALGRRERFFVATKVWTAGRQAGIDQMEESFRRLRVERIDLMQIHNLVEWGTHLKTLRKWKEAGRVRYIGITHYTPSAFSALSQVIESEPIDFVQLPYSLGVPDAETALLPLAAENGVAVLVNRPLEGGSALKRVRGKKLPGWAREFGCESWAGFLLKYVLANPAVTCVIPGTSNPEHMEDDLGAGAGSLPDAALCRRMREFWSGL